MDRRLCHYCADYRHARRGVTCLTFPLPLEALPVIDFLNDPVVRRELTLAVTFALQAGLALSVVALALSALFRAIRGQLHR